MAILREHCKCIWLRMSVLVYESVSTDVITDIPGRRFSIPFWFGSMVIRTAIRWTTLVKFPVGLSSLRLNYISGAGTLLSSHKKWVFLVKFWREGLMLVLAQSSDRLRWWILDRLNLFVRGCRLLGVIFLWDRWVEVFVTRFWKDVNLWDSWLHIRRRRWLD